MALRIGPKHVYTHSKYVIIIAFPLLPRSVLQTEAESSVEVGDLVLALNTVRMREVRA
jgi:hypothetical protein